MFNEELNAGENEPCTIILGLRMKTFVEKLENFRTEFWHLSFIDYVLRLMYFPVSWIVFFGHVIDT